MSCLRMQASPGIQEIPAFVGMTNEEDSYTMSCLRMQASPRIQGFRHSSE
ncbi:MAG: hypothetical protein ILNGONEN_00449 [Syntrophorhabdaceae bacterium]|nr:hypothetical protein [Syntrophorhabdaceae bacterium]